MDHKVLVRSYFKFTTIWIYIDSDIPIHFEYLQISPSEYRPTASLRHCVIIKE